LVINTLQTSGFEADIYRDSKYSLYHFVISPEGETEIVMWGQEPTQDEAEKTAWDWMKAFGKRASYAG
jgi:hypothetical protein